MSKLNIDLTAFDSLPEDVSFIVRKEIRAVCDSDLCRVKAHKSLRVGVGIVKNVSKQANFCPDCGSALFWEQVA